MIGEKDAGMLKAYITATWMGVVDSVTTGGCNTCGLGGDTHYIIDLDTHYIIDLEKLHKLVDNFVASSDNKEN